MSKTVMRFLLVSGLVLLAFNLRAPVSSIGPVLKEIQQGVNMSTSAAGLLTGIPCFAFGVLGLVAPQLAKRFGLHATLMWAGILLAGGVALRSIVATSAVFLLFSAVALCAIALLNVLLPAFIKTHFPYRIATMTTLYTVSMGSGSVLGAVLSAPVARIEWLGWRPAIGIWSIIGCIAVIPMTLLVLERKQASKLAYHQQAEVANKVHQSQEVNRRDHHLGTQTFVHSSNSPLRNAPLSLWKLRHSPKARAITVFFGVQSAHAYVQMGWLAQFFRDQGACPTTAGSYVAMIQLMIIPGGLLAPTIVANVKRPDLVCLGLALLLVPGYGGLMLAPMSLPWLWVGCLAISNACFPIGLLMIGNSGKTAHVTAQLSAFVQGIGYFISGLGPVLVGALYAWSHSWTIPLIFLLACVVPFAWGAYRAGQSGYVEDEITLRADSHKQKNHDVKTL
ncbi:MAG: MFS transporter [Actinomycetaceae bacterium]|nr:MFS transporter [Actinomycetaceae bacterium]